MIHRSRSLGSRIDKLEKHYGVHERRCYSLEQIVLGSIRYEKAVFAGIEDEAPDEKPAKVLKPGERCLIDLMGFDCHH